jgi:Glycosyl transferase family 11
MSFFRVYSSLFSRGMNLSNQDNSLNAAASSKYIAKNVMDSACNAFEVLEEQTEGDLIFSVDEPLSQQSVLSMSSMGKLGRFGNQLFQYAFLRICAQQSGARIECAPWIGQTLFGHHDAPVAERLPPAIEYQDLGENIFDEIPEFIPYLENLAASKSSRVGPEALGLGLENVDLWGYFQLHTYALKPYQTYFRSLFRPVDDLETALLDGLNILRSKGKTIVGLHVRRGDYIKEPRLGFTLVVPTKWYCAWLEEIWDELEEPVLFLCSDDLDKILPDFAKFSPVTARDLEIKLPERMKSLDIEFYIDFFMLSQCDTLCISNSIFSFAASMLNERAHTFVRPHWDFSSKFTAFDPWDSEPLLWFGGKHPKFLKSLMDTVYITYVTQGIWATLKCFFFYIPKSQIKNWGIHAYLGYQGSADSRSYLSESRFSHLKLWHVLMKLRP